MSRPSFIAFIAAFFSALMLSSQHAHTQGRGQGRGQALTLPDGTGKDIVQTQCTKCHALGLIANSGGYTRQGWEDLIGTMVMLSPDQKTQVATYLATNFPEASYVCSGRTPISVDPSPEVHA